MIHERLPFVLRNYAEFVNRIVGQAGGNAAARVLLLDIEMAHLPIQGPFNQGLCANIHRLYLSSDNHGAFLTAPQS